MEAPKPNTMLLELTRRCHRRCSHCAVSAGGVAPSVMEDLAPRILDGAARLGIETLDLTGGEPLSSPAFFGLLEAAQRLGIRVRVCATTAETLDDATLRRFASIRRDPPVFSISLDGIDEASGDALRGSGASEAARRSIERVGSFGGRVWVVTALHAKNAGRLETLLEWIDARPWIEKWKVAPCRPAGRGRGGRPGLLDVDLVEAAEPLARRVRAGAVRVRVKVADLFKHNWLYEEVSYGPDDHPCAYVSGVITVTAGGDVVPCPPGGESGDASFRFGNLTERSLAEIIEGEAYRRFFELRVRDAARCAACELLRWCGGGCRANAVLFGQGLGGCDPVAFRRARHEAERA